MLLHPGQGLRDTQGWFHSIVQSCLLFSTQLNTNYLHYQNHLVDIFTDFREDKEASGRGREEDEEKENFFD